MPKRQTMIEHIVDELEDAEARCAAVKRIGGTAELLALSRYYNWDDGMAVPRAIIAHPDCDLGLALHLFHLAEGITYLTSDDDWKYQEDWATFCEILTERIKNGHYQVLSTTFEPEFTKVQQYRLKKHGILDVFLSAVHPNNTKC